MATSRMYKYMICLVKVACGSDHTLALTDKGEVYVWSANCRKQSDFNKDDLELSPIYFSKRYQKTR